MDRQLYTSIAQDDGQTSARLAISAAKDSTSMKIVALITAAYLPGTFIAVRRRGPGFAHLVKG